jgi:hypothetical protein
VTATALTTRLDKAAEAARLREEGLNGIQIAEAMGISRSQAYALLADPDGATEAARKRRYKGTCLDCGRETAYREVGFHERCHGCTQRHKAKWDRAKIVAAIRRWTRRYGEPPGANDWSTAMARGRPEKLARLHEGDSVPTVQHYFGSWSAAIKAAGLTPRPRSRPKGVASR